MYRLCLEQSQKNLCQIQYSRSTTIFSTTIFTHKKTSQFYYLRYNVGLEIYNFNVSHRTILRLDMLSVFGVKCKCSRNIYLLSHQVSRHFKSHDISFLHTCTQFSLFSWITTYTHTHTISFQLLLLIKTDFKKQAERDRAAKERKSMWGKKFNVRAEETERKREKEISRRNVSYVLKSFVFVVLRDFIATETKLNIIKDQAFRRHVGRSGWGELLQLYPGTQAVLVQKTNKKQQ